jgi:hypothetical protein
VCKNVVGRTGGATAKAGVNTQEQAANGDFFDDWTAAYTSDGLNLDLTYIVDNKDQRTNDLHALLYVFNNSMCSLEVKEEVAFAYSYSNEWQHLLLAMRVLLFGTLDQLFNLVRKRTTLH